MDNYKSLQLQEHLTDQDVDFLKRKYQEVCDYFLLRNLMLPASDPDAIRYGRLFNSFSADFKKRFG
jgi:hypothetical protein